MEIIEEHIYAQANAVADNNLRRIDCFDCQSGIFWASSLEN